MDFLPNVVCKLLIFQFTTHFPWVNIDFSCSMRYRFFIFWETNEKSLSNQVKKDLCKTSRIPSLLKLIMYPVRFAGPPKPQENLSHTHRDYDGQSARVVGLSIPNAAVETVLQGELFPYSFILTSWLFM